MKSLILVTLVVVALGLSPYSSVVEGANENTTTPAPGTAEPGQANGEVEPLLFTATFNSSMFADFWSDNTTVNTEYNATSNGKVNLVVSFTFNQMPYLPEGRREAAQTPVPDAAVNSGSGSGNDEHYAQMIYVLRYRRENWLLDLYTSGEAGAQLGLVNLDYTVPTKPPATSVPSPVALKTEIAADPGTLRFFIRFRQAYHYTEPGTGKLLSMVNPYTVGPNITGVGDIIAEMVGIDPTEYDRIRFITADVNIHANRYLRRLQGLMPSSYLASFEVDPPTVTYVGGQPKVAFPSPTVSATYRRIFFMQEGHRNDLCDALEGCLDVLWQPKAEILTFAEFAKEGNKEYFASKIWFFLTLMVILCFFGGWLAVLWIKSKSTV